MASYVARPSEHGKARLDHLLYNFLKEVILLEAVTCLVFLMVATKNNASKVASYLILQLSFPLIH